MGVWKWEGFNQEGRKVKGEEEAQSENALKRILRAKKIRPTHITPPSIFDVDLGEWLVEKGLGKPFGNKELCHFTRQLSVMVDAGIPILQALEILFKQERHPILRKAIKAIHDDVGKGKALFEAMSKHKGFDNLYTNLVKAGESAGILDEILDKLAEYMESQEALKKKIKKALTYPSFVMVISFGVVYGMLAFVVPKFADMVKGSGQELPWITQFVMDISDLLSNYAMYIIPGVFIGLAVFVRFTKTEVGKPMLDRALMKLPIISAITIKGNLSSFLRTLSTMVSSGVPLIDSLKICSDTIGNEIIKRDLDHVRKLVTEGKTLAEPIFQIDYFPEMVAQMVKVGEQTGQMDSMMGKVSRIFEEEVSDSIDTMTSFIEPALIVFLGLFVGVILIAMYMPIFMRAGSG